MDEEQIRELTQLYPMLTYIRYNENIDFVGVLQTANANITGIYSMLKLTVKDDRKRFLDLVNIWWDESNRRIPINVFLGSDWNPFKDTLCILNTKWVEFVFGPQTVETGLLEKKSKRTSTIFVKTPRSNIVQINR